MRIATSFLIITILLSSIATIAAPAAQATTSGTLTITKNTVLSEDHYGSIIIAQDGVTLNGNGHTVTGGGTGTGILLNHRTGVTIKNLKVKNFTTGISVGGYSNNNIISGNSILHNSYGIELLGTGSNTVIRNIVSYNSRDGIRIWSSNNNALKGNVISHNKIGIILQASSNTFTDNNVSNNDYGVWLLFPSYNKFYHNNFISNPTQVYVEDRGHDDLFNLPAPIGGNYWSNYDTPAEGCVDSNNDGFCDSPFIIWGSNDYLPWTRMNGWLTPTIKGLIDQVKGLHLPSGIENELVSILNNAKKSLDKGNDDAAINQLKSFINKVEAQSGKNIPEGDADTLIANSKAIIAQLKH